MSELAHWAAWFACIGLFLAILRYSLYSFDATMDRIDQLRTASKAA